jgi:ADP-ribose pyrophosphatase YjhB (NUDIX family)
MTTWKRIHLATGILERDGRILLVASRYPNHAQPLWNLPGGRQESPESLTAAVAREFLEETSLVITVRDLAYIAESFDHGTSTHFTNFAFHVTASGEPHVPPGDAHALECGWFTRDELAHKLVVAVVREPLLTHLVSGSRHYFGYDDPGITIEFAD